MTYQPGDLILDKYRIEKTLGQGAFGEVYLVTHRVLGVPRAVKVLRRELSGLGSGEYSQIQARFQLEAQLGAQIHPHLLLVFDCILSEEISLLEMEYAAGGSLTTRIQKNRAGNQLMPVDEAVRIAAEIAEGLAALHARDIVHRDLKPSNILFDEHGQARVADLGLAQVPGGPSNRSQNSEGTARPIPGTDGYMSPEQVSTRGLLTPPSDIYSLGLVLFEMLTGRSYSLQRPGTRAGSLRKELSASLDDLLARMLAKNYRERPWDGAETAGLLREVLQDVGSGKTQAREESRLRQAEELRKKQAAEELARQQAEEKKRRELLIELAPGVTMEFVRVPAGEFLMGSDPKKDEQADPNEQPQHRVKLDEYLIGKYPVTNRQYQAFVQSTGRQAPQHWRDHKIPAGKGDHPVVYVNWQDAADFCAWAAKVSGVRVRLPSEAEWEKAARGTDGRIYPWGDAAPDARRCNYNENVWDTTAVGRYSPAGDSPFGCADMAGNVWEWVADWCNPKIKYPSTPVSNPTGPASGSSHYLRGGSWALHEHYARCANRLGDDPASADESNGFRCARSQL